MYDSYVMSQYYSLCLSSFIQVCVVYLWAHTAVECQPARCLIGRHLFPRANWLNVPEITALAFFSLPLSEHELLVYIISYLFVCVFVYLFISSKHGKVQNCCLGTFSPCDSMFVLCLFSIRRVSERVWQPVAQREGSTLPHARAETVNCFFSGRFAQSCCRRCCRWRRGRGEGTVPR